MQERPYRTLVVSLADRIATVTLNRPERRNAIGSEMSNELLYALADATEDADVVAVVLTGAGTAFCAGGDFAQMTSGGTESALPHRGTYQDLLLALWRTTKPVIARVNGHAMGGGLGLVAASTIAIASTEAKLGTPEVNVGLFPFMILAVLERVMPRRRLLEMMLRGERLSAEEAARVGLVSRAVAPEALDAAVAEWADLFRGKSPTAIRLGLEAMRDADDLSLEEKLPLLEKRLFACLATEDAREGLAAFLQKREPRWTGR